MVVNIDRVCIGWVVIDLYGFKKRKENEREREVENEKEILYRLDD